MIQDRIPYLIPPVMSLLTAYILAIIVLFKGKLTNEKLLLAIICFFWSLLSWAFLCHNLSDDITFILKAERFIHSFYVFTPAVTLLFFQVITGLKNRFALIASFSVSAVLAFFVHTDYYFYSFYHYSWGMIAKGGIAFTFFFIYGAIASIYIFYLFIKKLKNEKNSLYRLKLYYPFIAYFLTLLLTMTNFPAMNGIDFYPMSNLVFIPLGIMTYGILKYRLIDISGAIHFTFIWVILSSLIIVPNVLVFEQIKEWIHDLGSFYMIIIFITWFEVNYLYFSRVQPLINRLLNSKKYRLEKKEREFIKNIALLRNIDALCEELINIFRKTLDTAHVGLYMSINNQGIYSNIDGRIVDLHETTVRMLANCKEMILQKSILESDQSTGTPGRMVASLLGELDCEYLVPLTSQNVLIAIIIFSEKNDRRQISGDEYKFIRNIAAYASIFLANSVMYKNIIDINENLELLVKERTNTIDKHKSELEKDIVFARRIQISLLPKNIPVIPKVKIAYKYEPVMGVGGDFLDIHYRDGMNELGLFICDVSGHGASSAMIASMVKMSLNSWGTFIQKPGNAFAEIKKLLSGKIGDNFITAFMCCIDLDSGIVTSSCAGHPPMIILRSTGDVEYVKPFGKIIMDMVDTSFEEVKIQINPGDKIVLYTDGVIEARKSENVMIGEKNFAEMLKRYSTLEPCDLCNRIYDDIFSSGSRAVIDDDFALLVAEYTL